MAFINGAIDPYKTRTYSSFILFYFILFFWLDFNLFLNFLFLRTYSGVMNTIIGPCKTRTYSGTYETLL